MTAIDSRTVPIVVWQVLRTAKCETLDDIRRFGREEFQRIPGCGRITLRKIEDMIGGVWDVTAAEAAGLRAAGAGKTWEPTVNLRWGRALVIRGDGAATGTRPELQQLWRCVQTRETEWRPVPVEP